jgi:hypothetical protein
VEAVAGVDDHVFMVVDDDVLAGTLGQSGEFDDFLPFHGANS